MEILIGPAVRRAVFVTALSTAFAASAEAVGLGGSPASMRLQHDVAVEHDYEFLNNSFALRELVADGRLDELTGNADYRLARVSHPYAQPEVRLFIERLAAQYRAATGGQLVVTSLTRPSSEQPRNAHKLSVHPAGMAVDFRIPKTPAERAWLERTLLDLENAGVLDVTRERSPAHYHVAVFPDEYRAYVGVRDALTASDANSASAALNSSVHWTTPMPDGAPRAGSGVLDRSNTAPIAAFLGFSLFAIPAVILRRSKRRTKL